MAVRHSGGTAAITLGELTRIAPLSAADPAGLCDPDRQVEQVVLAEDVDRLRRTSPHTLVVLHERAATGAWSLAAALHLAWERNLSGVVVPQRIATESGVALARRLSTSMLSVPGSLADIALALAGQVGAPRAARALRLAQCAQRLAEASGLRGILAVLGAELDAAVALVAGDSVLAGRAAALTDHAGTDPAQSVEVEVRGPAGLPWARLIATLPRSGGADADLTTSMLHLARPALQAAWAQTRLESSMDVAHEQAAFALMRRASGPPAGRSAEESAPSSGETPSWVSELGWRVNGVNRAVWLTPVHPGGPPPAELTHLVRAAWHRNRPGWPLIAEADGWLTWHGGPDGTPAEDDPAAVRRAVAAFRETAAAHGLVLGVGRADTGVAGLLRSVSEARLAAHLARTGGPGTTRWFDQVGPSAALAWLPDADIRHVAELSLGELMAARDRDVLIPTALAVLDCGGSLSQASGRLGVHRNTVLARIARARQLGLELDDPSRRLALHVICYSLAAQLSGSAPASMP